VTRSISRQIAAFQAEEYPLRDQLWRPASRAPGSAGMRNGHHLASALRVRGAVNTALAGDRSGRLDLNQRPFGPQPNALLVSGGAVELLFRIPMRFQLL
jgi:hypothetical protein